MIVRKVGFMLLVAALALNTTGVSSAGKEPKTEQLDLAKKFNEVTVRYEKIEALPEGVEETISITSKADLEAFKKEAASHASATTSQHHALKELRAFIKSSSEIFTIEPDSLNAAAGTTITRSYQWKQFVKCAFPQEKESVVIALLFNLTAQSGSSTQELNVNVVVLGTTATDVHGVCKIMSHVLKEPSQWLKYTVGAVATTGVVVGVLFAKSKVRRVQNEHAQRSSEAQYPEKVAADVDALQKITAEKDGSPVTVCVHNLDLDVPLTCQQAAKVAALGEYDQKALHIFVSSQEHLLKQEMQKVAMPVGVLVKAGNEGSVVSTVMFKDDAGKIKHALHWDGSNLHRLWKRHSFDDDRYAVNPNIKVLIEDAVIPMAKDLFGVQLTIE